MQGLGFHYTPVETPKDAMISDFRLAIGHLSDALSETQMSQHEWLWQELFELYDRLWDEETRLINEKTQKLSG
jgi:hypothetical protein